MSRGTLGTSKDLAQALNLTAEETGDPERALGLSKSTVNDKTYLQSSLRISGSTLPQTMLHQDGYKKKYEGEGARNYSCSPGSVLFLCPHPQPPRMGRLFPSLPCSWVWSCDGVQPMGRKRKALAPFSRRTLQISALPPR